MSDKNLEQRINVKFCVEIGKSASKTSALLTVAYGEYSMKKSTVFERYRRFKEGRKDVQVDPRSGQLKTQRTVANVVSVRTLVCSDRRLGVRVITDEMNMNRETVRQIIKEDLEMRRFSAGFLSRILTHSQKNVGFTFHLIFYAMQRCLIGTLPVMKRGFFNMTRKQNERTCSGNHIIHLGRKNTHVSVAVQDHACVFL